MKPVSYTDRWVGRLKWLSIVLIVALLATVGLPAAVPANLAQASPDSWTQSTLADFNSGTFSQTRAIIWDPGDPLDDGDVILDSIPLDQENWEPVQAPATPELHGDNRQAQTFTASKNGRWVTITLYLSTEGTPPKPLVVELRNCVPNDATGKPGATLYVSATISGVTGTGGNYDVSMVLSEENAIVSGNTYAIVVYQQDNDGNQHNNYKWWYGGEYAGGKAWKQTSSSAGWSGGGFGSHDTTFRIYISGDPPGGKGYYPSGTLTSSIHDAGAGGINWGIMSWDETLNGQTVTMKVRTSNNSDMTGATVWASCPTVANGQDISGLSSVTGGHRYIQYQAYLARGADPNQTPVLHDVTITYAVNSPPVANDDAYSTDEDTVLNVSAPGILGNDSDADSDTLSVTAVDDSGTVGTVTWNPNGSFSYDPNGQFEYLAVGETAIDIFTYTIDDGNGGTDTATVTITINGVNDAPVANDDSASTDEDTSVDIDVLANDTDAEDDTLTIISVSDPLHGSATINPDDTVTYTPDADYNGPDGFNYTISDGTDTDTATGSVAINPVNDAPVADDQSVTTAEDTAKGITLTGSDADLPPGTLTFDSNIATVSITVNPVNDAPVANDQSVSTDEDTPLAITLTGSDADLPPDTLTFSIVDSPTDGTL